MNDLFVVKPTRKTSVYATCTEKVTYVGYRAAQKWLEVEKRHDLKDGRPAEFDKR